MKRTLLKLSLAGLAATMTLMPAISMAQGKYDRDHRQSQQNQWQNIGVGSAALGIIGLLTHDDTLAIAGAAGAIYSDTRYEQDRNSQRGRWDRDRNWNSRDRDQRDWDQQDRDRRDQVRRYQESRNSRDRRDHDDDHRR